MLRAPRFIERSVTVAAVLGIAAIAVLSTGVYIGGVGGTIIASIGAALLSVALLSVLYDAYLKDVLLGEIYGAMEIQQNVRAIDLRDILKKEQLDLRDLIAESDGFTAVPLDPETWARTDWQQLVECAAHRSVDVTVLLPDRDSPQIDVLAQRLAVDREHLVQQISTLPDQLARSWDEKAAVDTGSAFQVILYSGVPAVGLLVTDTAIVIEVPPALTHAATDRSTLAVVLGRNGSSALVSDFVDEQLFKNGELNAKRIPDFSHSVMRPLRSEVSPDPPIQPRTSQEE